MLKTIVGYNVAEANVSESLAFVLCTCLSKPHATAYTCSPVESSGCREIRSDY